MERAIVVFCFIALIGNCVCKLDQNDIVMQHLLSAKPTPQRSTSPSKTPESRQGLLGMGGLLTTMTGVLAAVGGGYLVQSLVSSVANGANRRQQYPLNPAQFQLQQQLNERPDLYNFAMWDTTKAPGAMERWDVPETSFQLLGMQQLDCREKAICELEQYLKRKGIPQTLLQSVSPKIPGMKRYSGAVARGLGDKDCSHYYAHCRNQEVTPHRVTRAIGEFAKNWVVKKFA